MCLFPDSATNRTVYFEMVEIGKSDEVGMSDATQCQYWHIFVVSRR